jgi:(p)ppGpp synthase/HD superfamily hydrolase
MVQAMNKLVIVAWLHDILEDTDCPEDVLRALFDGDIVDGVVAMTFKYGSKRTHRDSESTAEETREQYLVRCKANQLGRQAKMADSFCNMRMSLIRGHLARVAKYGDALRVMAS